VREYYDNHRFCPICHGNIIETTTMGWWIFEEGYRNPNKAYCNCGWKGMEDDLVR